MLTAVILVLGSIFVGLAAAGLSVGLRIVDALERIATVTELKIHKDGA